MHDRKRKPKPTSKYALNQMANNFGAMQHIAIVDTQAIHRY
jgi:hypothetical protein